jgi:GPH family glycoside/pentoside/hexuronide:cation symporter
MHATIIGRGVGPTAVLAYAVGSFGTGLYSTVPTVLLLYYCTAVVGLPAGWATVIVFAPKIWAIVWDPVVGTWSDRPYRGFGLRQPFLVAGAAGVALAFVAVFAAPKFARPDLNALWVGGAYFSMATLYSLFAVPYIAIPAEVGSDALTRVRLVRWRMFVAMLGVLAGAGVAPWLVSAAGGGHQGYAFMAYVLAGTCAIAMCAPLLMLRHVQPSRQLMRGQRTHTFLAHLHVVLRCKSFRWLTLSYLLTLSAVGALGAASPYLVIQTLGRTNDDLGNALALMLVLTTTTIPVWSALAQRIGDRKTLMTALAAYAILAVVLGAVAGDTSWSVVLLLYALLGIPFAAAQVIPFTLLAHLVREECASGGAVEGVFTGVWTASEKVGLALGPALVGLALSITGTSRNAAPELIAFIPPALLLSAMLPLALSGARRQAI